MPTLLKKKSTEQQDTSLAHVLRVAELAAEKKAEDIKAYDVRELTLVADAFLMCSTSSEPQHKAVMNCIKEGMKKVGLAPLQIEGAQQDGWLVIDYGAVIVHIFRKDARLFYDLDGMWADGKEINLDLD